MRIPLRPCLPLLLLASGCANSSEYDRPSGEVGDGSGSSVFEPTRVAQIELAISDADLTILEEQKAQGLGASEDDEGEYVPAHLTFDGTDLGTVGIRVKGNSSRRGAGVWAAAGIRLWAQRRISKSATSSPAPSPA